MGRHVTTLNTIGKQCACVPWMILCEQVVERLLQQHICVTKLGRQTRGVNCSCMHQAELMPSQSSPSNTGRRRERRKWW